MKYLLDTGVWLRAVDQVESIPKNVLQLLQHSNEVYGLSAISLWEIGKKFQIGKLRLPKDLRDWFEDALAANISVIPLSEAIVADAMRLPEFPNRDPADELIVATTRIHNLILITTDTKLKNYPYAKVHYFTPLLKT